MQRCSGHFYRTLSYGGLTAAHPLANDEACPCCRKLLHLDSTIIQTQMYLEKLQAERGAVWSRFNDVHPSIIHRMPVEVASIIFDIYVGEEGSPLTLGAVCQKWRQIAWSTPGLWTTFTFQTSRTTVSSTRLQLAREWLSRSGSHSLSITLHTNFPFETVQICPNFLLLIDAINERCNQWHSLNVTLPTKMLARLDDSNCTSSDLNYLELSSNRLADLTLETLTRVAPRIVKVSTVNLSPRSLRWDRVSSLEMASAYDDEIYEIFRLAPRLRTCLFHVVGSREVGSPTDAYRPVFHSRLRSLDLDLPWRNMDQFLNNLELPAMEDLSITVYDASLPAHAFISLVTRSAMVLKSLSLNCCDLTGEEWIQIAEVVPSLERLVIVLSCKEADDLDEFYQALTGHLDSSHNLLSTSSIPLLPSLQYFRWAGDGAFPWQHIASFLSPRHPDDNTIMRPLDEIRIYCHRDLDSEDYIPIPYIPTEVLESLEGYEGVKFQIEVELDGGPADLRQLSFEKLEGR